MMSPECTLVPYGPSDASRVRIQLLRGHAEVDACQSELESVANQAGDHNIFYAPWMLLAGLRAFADDNVFVLVARNHDGQMIGYAPLRNGRMARDGWGRSLQLWRHEYCYLCTPQVMAGREREFAAAMLDWIGSGDAPARRLDLHDIAAGSRFSAALDEELGRRRGWSCNKSSFVRALFLVRHKDAAELPTRRRRKWLKRERRLAGDGCIALTSLADTDDPVPWIKRFLALEASGWKGRAGSAMAATPARRAYFEIICKAAHARNSLCMLALEVDGRDVAMQCNFIAAAKGYAFKVAYDESHAHASPGWQLELHAMRFFRERYPQLQQVDSCAKPDHTMMNALWPHQHPIARYLLASGTPWVRAPIFFRNALQSAKLLWQRLRS